MVDVRGKCFVVTGGAGFIGSHLVERLLTDGARSVGVVDNFFLGKDENLAGIQSRFGSALAVYREDAADFGAMRAVMDREQPEIVFNLATKALLYSFFNPAGACRVNLDIALTLAELQRADAFCRLLHVSTSEVYGTARYVPMDEAHPLLAETTYAAGKGAADLALASYIKMFDLDIVTVRPFNNYGPRQNDQALAAVIPLTIKRIFSGEPPVLLGDGLQTRDFIFVNDTVEAMIAMAFADTARGEVVNLASGEETTIRSIVETICGIMGYGGEIRYENARPADVLRHMADVSKASAILGKIARTPLTEGLKETVRWYMDQYEKGPRPV